MPTAQPQRHQARAIPETTGNRSSGVTRAGRGSASPPSRSTPSAPSSTRSAQRVVADLGERDVDYIRNGDQRPARPGGRRPRAALGRLVPARLAGRHGRALACRRSSTTWRSATTSCTASTTGSRTPSSRARASSGTRPAPATSGATPTTTCTTPTPTSWARTATSATASCACPRTSPGGPTTSATRSTRRCWRPSSSTAWRCTTSRPSASSRARPRWREKREMLKSIWRKVRRQTLKDYVLFPALSGPGFPFTLAGNATANLARNLWSFTIIFCGHFPDGTQEFTEEETADETPRRVVLPPAARLGEPRGRQALPHHVGQPQPPDRAPPVPRPAGAPLRRDLGRGARDLRALRPAVQLRPAGQAVRQRRRARSAGWRCPIVGRRSRRPPSPSRPPISSRSPRDILTPRWHSARARSARTRFRPRLNPA